MFLFFIDTIVVEVAIVRGEEEIRSGVFYPLLNTILRYFRQNESIRSSVCTELNSASP